MRNLINLRKAITKYGVGPVVTFVALDGYRRGLRNERLQAELNAIKEEAKIAKELRIKEEKIATEARYQEELIDRQIIKDQNEQNIKLLKGDKPKYDNEMEEGIKIILEIKTDEDKENFTAFFKNLVSKNPEDIKSDEEKEIQSIVVSEITTVINLKNISPELQEILDAYRKRFKISIEKEQAIRENALLNTKSTKSKEDELEAQSQANVVALIELKKDIYKSDIGGIFISAYNQYVKYLESLTPDKIVCLFNIIVSGITLSSFSSVLAIMLSDNIINRIKFLENYPIILKLLRLRNNINRKVAKFHLLMHFIWILAGLLCNIYMFFL